MKPLLVGEANPYQSDPRLAQRFALYPEPPNCAGWNLCCRIMQLEKAEYLARFDRVNLCDGKWSMKAARKAAAEIAQKRNRAWVDATMQSPQRAPSAVVLFGSKVSTAFDFFFEPFTFVDRLCQRFVVLPHPSGLSRAWNEPGAYERARAVLREAGVL